MTDVARHAGVALGTVSNTLNNPEKVAEATRRKVLAAIAELGFVRNDAARSLAAGNSTTVGLVLADLGNSFFVDIARGAEQVMRRNGMNVLIANTDIDRDREVRNLELFEQHRVAGIILAPLDTPLARSQVLPASKTPTVLVNFDSESHAHPSVAVNEHLGGRLAARHLLELGRRRLLFVGGPLFLTAVRGRYEGAAEAVAAFPGAEMEHLETRGLNIRHGRAAAQTILDRGAGRYDGIIAAADLVAIGLIQALGEREGFRVPADLAITGYDNNHFASESAVPVTTVGQPGEEMGRVAADLLLERIARPDASVRSLVLDPHLIPRRSTLGELWHND
ncbi:LacI family DNA-binding transcriptional regulator [Microbacterium terricola]|uniref:LacI family transcriptional regulator n=1 Tax=Microbacterium terricola TaxID=344163 RepID=A0ABM8E283_9MICO|nr:LacI family DNA-binding transcriptional regulator [Microbacterium terricola]UYK40406.1 LacI family transcriptional regulator [Microbacterium terricola]BDV31876.1 LacI family transcriptional regulator [Microbacterium terricola]